MLIVHDAVIYKNLGQLLWQKGFLEYIKAGPTHEPIYPMLVSLSIGLGSRFSVSYQTIQILLQLSLLLLTQLLTLRILKILKINTWLMAGVVLYIGFSPALLNAALSLWSEIAVFPIIPALILVNFKIWQNIDNSSKKIFLYAVLLAAVFLGAVFIKGIFEPVAFVFLIPYIILLTKSLVSKKAQRVKNILIFLIIFFITFNGSITLYKFINKKYNGVFTLTDRGSWILYGNTARRVSSMTSQQILSSLTFIPGEEICTPFFGKKACSFWLPYAQDNMGHDREKELRQKNLSQDEINTTLIFDSMKSILQNPLQYAFFYISEGLKTMFWESSHVGFVVYPDGLQRLYDTPVFFVGLRFLMALLTFGALAYCVRFVWRNKSNIFREKPPRDQAAAMILFMLFLIFPFIMLYSLFYIVTRFTLPMGSVYLCLIAFSFQNIIGSRRKLIRHRGNFSEKKRNS